MDVLTAATAFDTDVAKFQTNLKSQGFIRAQTDPEFAKVFRQIALEDPVKSTAWSFAAMAEAGAAKSVLERVRTMPDADARDECVKILDVWAARPPNTPGYEERTPRAGSHSFLNTPHSEAPTVGRIILSPPAEVGAGMDRDQGVQDDGSLRATGLFTDWNDGREEAEREDDDEDMVGEKAPHVLQREGIVAARMLPLTAPERDRHLKEVVLEDQSRRILAQHFSSTAPKLTHVKNAHEPGDGAAFLAAIPRPKSKTSKVFLPKSFNNPTTPEQAFRKGEISALNKQKIADLWPLQERSRKLIHKVHLPLAELARELFDVTAPGEDPAALL